MSSPRLTDADRDALVEELAVALEELLDHTCAEMAPLWLDATRSARAPLGAAAELELGFEPSAAFLALGKAGRSKYRALAAWRHAVLWKDLLPGLGDWRAATETVYFTPYPANRPPYAWTRGAAEAPGAERFPSPTTLKHHAKEGARELVQGLLDLLASPGVDERAEIEADLLRVATRETLTDVLKLEELDPWRRPR